MVTCIEADHLDNYGSLAEIEATFAAFAARSRDGRAAGRVRRRPRRRGTGQAAAAALPMRVRTYGESPDADYRVTGVPPRGMATRLTVTRRAPAPRTLDHRGARPAQRAERGGRVRDRRGTRLPAETVGQGLAAYRGAQRRMEPKGEADGVRVLDSYAHHPTELAADLTAARDVAAGGQVIAVFQPHLYSRTRFFAAEFGAALGLADEALVLDVYAAREEPEPGVTGKLVADAVPGGRARFVPDAAAVPDVIAGLAKPGDLVLTMGAGDVTTLGPADRRRAARRAGDAR